MPENGSFGIAVPRAEKVKLPAGFWRRFCSFFRISTPIFRKCRPLDKLTESRMPQPLSARKL